MAGSRVITHRAIALLVGALVLMFMLGMPGRAYAAGSSGLTAGSASISTQAPQSQAVTAAPVYNQFGIDVSVHQGKIDWKAASGQVKYVIIRCGFGSDSKAQDDLQWLNNVKGCQDYNIPFGVYLYSYATNTNMAASEARHTIRCLKEAGLTPDKVSLPIYLDMEDPSTADLKPEQYAAIYNTYVATMRQAGYVKVGVYANATWWENKLTKLVVPYENRWVAHWDVKAPGLAKNGKTIEFPTTYKAGSSLWQYKTPGPSTVTGIKGNLDCNYARSDWSYLFESESKQNVYRLYNPYNGEHLYTTDANERDVLSSKYKWNYEGVAWSAPRKDGIPVYRLYNPYSGEHLYTKDTNEVRVLTSSYGWRKEGTAWYSTASGVPLYRLYNPRMQIGAHHYTTDAHERDVLKKSYGWRYEGIAMYSPS